MVTTIACLSPDSQSLSPAAPGGASRHRCQAADAYGNASLRAQVDEFFRKHHASLIKFFSARLHSIHEAKDVAQDTYAWLLQHQEDPRILSWVGPINPLVYRVAWHIAGNRMAKRRRHMRLGIQMIAVSGAVAAPPEQLCAAQEDLAILEECLESLSPRSRMVFVLARLQDLSLKEIAQRMGMSVRSVQRHVERALEHCMRRQEGGDPTARLTNRNKAARADR